MRDIVHEQPDGVHVVIRAIARGTNVGVLILPDIGDSILDGFLDRIAEQIASDDTTVYIPELRGHPASQGAWSLHLYRADIAHWLAHYRHLHDRFYVVALGLSASTMLEYDDQAHRFRGTIPPIPDGMLLLGPTFSGEEILPYLSTVTHFTRKAFPGLSERLLARKVPKRLRRCRFANLSDSWRDLLTYRLAPVRAQTPTVVLAAQDEHADPFKRIFGSVRIRKVPWLHHLRSGLLSHAELLHRLGTVRAEFTRLREEDLPHRFRVAR